MLGERALRAQDRPAALRWFEMALAKEPDLEREVPHVDAQNFVGDAREALAAVLGHGHVVLAQLRRAAPVPRRPRAVAVAVAVRRAAVGELRRGVVGAVLDGGLEVSPRRAREVASLAVAPEEHTLKACSLVDSHCVLGILAAKEGGDGGGLAAAEAHFAHALRDAKRSGMPMLEVVAARDLKAAVVAAEAKADMMIDAACAKMNKTRTDLERYMRI